MQNLTTQRRSKKVIHTVKYCVSKESVQQTTNSSANVKHCKTNLQKEVGTLIKTQIKKIKLLDRKHLVTPKTTESPSITIDRDMLLYTSQYKTNNSKSLVYLKD